MALATVPVTLAPVSDVSPDPLPVINPAVDIFPPVMLAVTVNELNVPTLVILGCAAVVTVPAVVADVADPAVVAEVAVVADPADVA